MRLPREMVGVFYFDTPARWQFKPRGTAASEWPAELPMAKPGPKPKETEAEKLPTTWETCKLCHNPAWVPYTLICENCKQERDAEILEAATRWKQLTRLQQVFARRPK